MKNHFKHNLIILLMCLAYPISAMAAQPVLRITQIKVGKHTTAESYIDHYEDDLNFYIYTSPYKYYMPITVMMTIINKSDNVLEIIPEYRYYDASLTYIVDDYMYIDNGANMTGAYPLRINIPPSEIYSFTMTFNLGGEDDPCNSENYMFNIWRIIPTLRVEMKLNKPEGMTIVSEPITWKSIMVGGE